MAAHGHSDDGTDFAHPMPLPVLLAVFFALVILTIITVAQASLDLGSFDVAVVMGIATIKAILVGAFFMHLIADKPFNIIVFLSSFVFVGLFVIFTLSDSKMTSPAFEPKIDEPAATAGM
ncbi:cytochrome C oxidase subunit IV family protein [Aporhodopirellula aestuarii]|uniref:Cytochrome C oxidase subunit IV family protein n=1 Tax=Aporhodopirellula aestuarii TaxID=2950107 RepID=A0ABT0U1T3_9BACT|nr:cytochrome C oxidase subunit IV family protein [Aporhodopirellula aestuarii]MCM2370848.1 cytochrome C oxidase subunit IV family protein [Aporhodopirellula aestuarii]